MCEIVLLCPERRGVALNPSDYLIDTNCQIELFKFKSVTFFLGSIT